MNNRIYNLIIAIFTVIFFSIMTLRFMDMEKPTKQEMQNFSSLDKYYDNDICDYAFSQELDNQYCMRYADGKARTQLVYDCALLISDEMLTDCYWDSAIIKKDTNVCSEYLEGIDRDMCIWDIKVHFDMVLGQQSLEKIALCQEIEDPIVKEFCFGENYEEVGS